FHSSRGLPVALLVFLSAPTWARIVAADLRFLPPHRLDHIVSAGPRWRWRLRLRCRLARSAAGKCRHWCRAGVVHHHRRWCRTARCGPWRAHCDRRLGLAFLHRHGTEPEQVADDLLLDARFHVLEQRVAFFLVFDEGIALTVAAQADTLLQMIERVEVILPLRIDD